MTFGSGVVFARGLNTSRVVVDGLLYIKLPNKRAGPQCYCSKGLRVQRLSAVFCEGDDVFLTHQQRCIKLF